MSNEGVCRTAPATPGLLINEEGVCRTAQATPGLLIRLYRESKGNVVLNFYG